MSCILPEGERREFVQDHKVGDRPGTDLRNLALQVRVLSICHRALYWVWAKKIRSGCPPILLVLLA